MKLRKAQEINKNRDPKRRGTVFAFNMNDPIFNRAYGVNPIKNRLNNSENTLGRYS